MAFMDALQYAGESLDKPGRSVRGLLSGKIREGLAWLPFSDALGITDPSEATGGREMLENWGALAPNQEGLDAGDVAGFGAEILFDPLNLVGGGLIARSLGKAGKAGHAAEGALRQAAEMGYRNRPALFDKWSDDVINAGIGLDIPVNPDRLNNQMVKTYLSDITPNSPMWMSKDELRNLAKTGNEYDFTIGPRLRDADPMPPVMGGSPEDAARLGGAWNEITQRMPTAPSVKGVRIGEVSPDLNIAHGYEPGAAYSFGSSEVSLPTGFTPDALSHELVHGAQNAAGKPFFLDPSGLVDTETPAYFMQAKNRMGQPLYQAGTELNNRQNALRRAIMMGAGMTGYNAQR